VIGLPGARLKVAPDSIVPLALSSLKRHMLATLGHDSRRSSRQELARCLARPHELPINICSKPVSYGATARLEKSGPHVNDLAGRSERLPWPGRQQEKATRRRDAQPPGVLARQRSSYNHKRLVANPEPTRCEVAHARHQHIGWRARIF
jgi:hypothetical protein